MEHYGKVFKLPSCKLELFEWNLILCSTGSLHLLQATDTALHERLFNFIRRTARKSILSWIIPGPVNVGNCKRTNKNQPKVEPTTYM